MQENSSRWNLQHWWPLQYSPLSLWVMVPSLLLTPTTGLPCSGDEVTCCHSVPAGTLFKLVALPPPQCLKVTPHITTQHMHYIMKYINII